MVPAMTQTEHRIAQRHRTLKAGKIVLHHGSSVIDCTVRNISASGAAISVVNAAAIPAEFNLQFDSENRPCTVTWRRLERMGVRFK
jgi:hypothetical protein